MVGKRLPSRNDLRMDAQSRQFSATLSRFTPLVHPKARARPAQQSRDSLGLAKSKPGLTREQRTASQKEVRSGGLKPKWERLHKSTRGAQEQHSSLRLASDGYPFDSGNHNRLWFRV